MTQTRWTTQPAKQDFQRVVVVSTLFYQRVLPFNKYWILHVLIRLLK